MELIKLKPAFKDYLWGGDKLKQLYNKKTDLEIVAESWELSTHKDGSSIIASGSHQGESFKDFIENSDESIIGIKASKFPFFPVLIKFIDAKKALSIQVHPSDEYALKYENSYGKTEAWYVLEAEPNAFLYYGFKDEISKEEMAQRIKDNTFLDVLRKVEVKQGDIAVIDAGTIHAIGEGIVICEIQQNSNITYRVYDYDRRGIDGKPRQLHIKQALEVTNLKPIDHEVANCNFQNFEGYKKGQIVACKYFSADIVEVATEYQELVTADSFKSFTVVSGSGEIMANEQSFCFEKGDTFFATANLGSVKIKGNAKIIIAYV